MNNSQNRMIANILKSLKKSLLVSLGTIALSVGVAQTAKADVLNFDNVTNTTSYSSVPNGYGGLNWENFYAINKNYHPNSGYDIGTVSGSYTIFNAGATPATISNNFSGLFDFNSAYITSAWSSNTSVTVEGFAGGLSKYFKTFVVNNSAATKFDFNFLGIDKLRFSSSNSQFAMDNFTFNESVIPPKSTSVPEPGLLVGLFTITLSGATWLKRNNLKQAVQ